MSASRLRAKRATGGRFAGEVSHDRQASGLEVDRARTLFAEALPEPSHGESRMSGSLIGGRYILERRIAGGGMGNIWVALDKQLQRRVALKLMAPGRLASLSARFLFEQEAKAVAQLQNPHVVQIHDYGVDGDTPYIVMELLQGEDLEACLERQGRLAAPTVASLINQVARALASAHSANIVHRDLKPANLFLARVDSQEQVKVLDFGLAQLGEQGKDSEVASGKVLGTPRYMSPEQMRGEAVIDHRSDLWSLGIVAYRALTGRFPFTFDKLSELLSASACPTAELASSDVPELGPELDAFFARALHVEPSGRFQSALELASAFAALVESRRAARAGKVLVVDDEPSMAVLVKQRFRKQIRDAVYNFIFATDGVEALELLRQNPDVDVVLSDINMPRMDGLTFLSRVSDVNPLVKVIIISAYSDMENIRVAMNRGAFDFLVKPFNVGDLEATLPKAIRHVQELRRMLRTVEENQLLRMFVHNGIVERLLPLREGPGVVAGEKVEATVAFLDVKDFTAVARQRKAEAALQRLNANFDVIVPELTSRGGVVDKFIGAAVMVVFRGPEHLERALEACMAARRQLQQMAFRYGEQSPYTHGVCVGVDSGELLCGSVGAKPLGRLDYTAIGDAVNVAARLASLAGKDQILMTDTLRQRVDESFEFTAVGNRILQGAGSLVVHELVGRQAVKVSAATETASLEGKGPKAVVELLGPSARAAKTD